MGLKGDEIHTHTIIPISQYLKKEVGKKYLFMGFRLLGLHSIYEFFKQQKDLTAHCFSLPVYKFMESG